MAPRAQTLKALKLSQTRVTKNKVACMVLDILKTDKQGKPVGKLVELQAYPPDRRLCIVSLMKEYIARTSNVRNGQDQLLISHIEPHGEVARDTISRWIQEVMGLAKIDVAMFKPHSVRSASASAAHAADVPVHEILAKVGWRSEKTFQEFYNKPTRDDAYQNAILSAGT